MLRLVSPAARRRHEHAVAAFGPMAPEAEDFLRSLRRVGMRSIVYCRLTRNVNVMVSFSGGVLRVHRGYRTAPPEVLRAIVRFVERRSREVRADALRTILSHRVRTPRSSGRVEQTHPEDSWLAEELRAWHRRLNIRHFGCRLPDCAVRVSRRMTATLGHYTAAGGEHSPAEIVIAKAHYENHGWEEVKHTLLHEMVHQWQDVTGRPLDHGTAFRAKAAEVGITAAACRELKTRAGREAGERAARRHAARRR